MGTLHINVLGTSFTIRAQENEEYLQKLLGYYKSITKEVEKSLKNPTEIAIMSGIVLCDELYKEKQRNAKISSETKEDEEAEKRT
ncbi:MAG: cell division protein ZapA, partial [Treponema sp.]|nr:cell division protein ZapA [Treponema sp.]